MEIQGKCAFWTYQGLIIDIFNKTNNKFRTQTDNTELDVFSLACAFILKLGSNSSKK